MGHEKVIYIDIYHSIFDDLDLEVKEMMPLYKMDIKTDTDIDKVIENLKTLIFERYGDGLYIQAEEFSQLCYLNVVIMFGREYNFLVNYLKSINTDSNKDIFEENLTDYTFLTIDYLFSQKETAEILNELDELDVDSDVYFIEKKVFERGVGNYHEIIIIALLNGSLQAIGAKLSTYLMGKFKKHQNATIVNFNTNEIKSYIAEETGINKQDLYISKVKKLSQDKIEINLINRYKSIKVEYNKKSKEINYEIQNKTQTMI